MSNYWEEWEDYISETKTEKSTINKDELKQLEERKLIEEADIQLTKELFEDDKKNKSILAYKIDGLKEIKPIIKNKK